MTTYIFIGISNDLYVLLFQGGSFLLARIYAVPPLVPEVETVNLHLEKRTYLYHIFLSITKMN